MIAKIKRMSLKSQIISCFLKHEALHAVVIFLSLTPRFARHVGIQFNTSIIVHFTFLQAYSCMGL